MKPGLTYHGNKIQKPWPALHEQVKNVYGVGYGEGSAYMISVSRVSQNMDII